MEASKIEWTDHTFNPWVGCSKVHAGCTHCYAETLIATRYKRAVWGTNGTRVLTARANWAKPHRWNEWAKNGVCPKCQGHGELRVKRGGLYFAEKCGRCQGTGNIGPYRGKVFCASLADVFEAWNDTMADSDGGHGLTMDDARLNLFALIDRTPHLDWLLLTKRPQNIRRMWSVSGTGKDPGAADYLRRDNVWLGTSISDQASANKQVCQLMHCHDLAAHLFLSAEPLLGQVDLRNLDNTGGETLNAFTAEITMPSGHHFRASDIGPIGWVIIGGESGAGSRQFDVMAGYDLLLQARKHGVPVFFKQFGAFPFVDNVNAFNFDDYCDYEPFGDFAASVRLRLKNPKGGDPNEWPEEFRLREFPAITAI